MLEELSWKSREFSEISSLHFFASANLIINFHFVIKQLFNYN